MRTFLSLGVVAISSLTAVATTAAPAPAGRMPAAPSSVPDSLRPWIPWVMHDHEQELCPNLVNDADTDFVCAWGGRLELSLAPGGGRFSQTWELFAEGPIPLPGGGPQWPLDVKVDGRPAVATAGDDESDDSPQVRAPAGRHTVTGTFVWKRLPETLRVPERAALLSLTLSGRAVEFPSRSEAGTLFLRRDEEAGEAGEEDRLDITVHRRVADEIPLQLTTRITLNVAGKAREVVLGRSLPEGFVPQALDSPLPVRIEADGRLRVQLRPGQWVITLAARNSAPTTRMTRPRPDGPWKEGEEIWVFESRPSLRVVTVQGVPGVDPQQTTLPDGWKTLPAYVMGVDATMTLVERSRGDADPAADELSLQRSLWLDFDGDGLTARDEIRAAFRRAWRLSMGADSRLGRAAVGGQDQFITRLHAKGGDGIEIRQRDAVIVAESRVDRTGIGIPAVGWDHDFQSVSARLSLPPGWRLFHASGADSVSTSWLRNWTLLELFLVLITGIGIGKLFGVRTGALALVTLALIFPEARAPMWIWLVVLVGEALVRALPEGAIRRVARLLRVGAWVVLVLVAIPFAVQHVRVGMHPALAAGGGEFYAADSGGEVGYLARGEATPVAAPEGAESPPVTTSSDLEGKEATNLPHAPAPKPQYKQYKRSAKVEDTDKDSVIDGREGWAADETVGGKVARSSSRGARQAPAAAHWNENNLSTYDPNVLVQTGPGVPRWAGAVVHLGWNGPVERTQRLALWLLPPWLNFFLAFLRVVLVAWLIWRLGGGRRGFVDKWRLGPATPALLVVAGSLALLLPATARAADTGAYPSDELLKELQGRLTEKAKCEPNCASIGRLSVEASPDRLRLRFDVGAEAATVAALPGHAKHWLPAQVLLDGKPAGTMVRDVDGALYVRLPAGGHQVVMEGPLPARDVVQIPFPLKPHALSTATRGWRVEGLDEDGQVGESLQLAREQSAPKGGGEKGSPGGLAPTSLPPFVTVERTLELGLKWVAQTTVTRQSPAGAAIVLEIPLLPGESVITAGVRVSKGKVQVNLGAEESALKWESTMAQVPALTLEAPAAGGAAAWAETWTVNPGSLWHVAFSGIPPVQPEASGARAPLFRPWPGEKVSIAITRPAGTGGQTLTIDHAQLVLAPGIRSTAATLTVQLRSSRGGEHAFGLPAGATLERVKINGNVQPLRQDGRLVTVPVSPGTTTVEVVWREPAGLTLRYRAPEVDLRVAGVNASVRIELPGDRWVLYPHGPRLGPAVLFWSVLVVFLLAGFALARSPWTPLRARHWILLGIGLVQTSVPAAAIVAGLFFAFGWRRSRPPMRHGWQYDLSQLLLAIWTVAAITVLAGGVGHGLLGYPDMMIAGNGSASSSSGTSLAWFADRVSGPLPQPWVVSVPLLAYRLAMLAWSLWLALAVIRWARWVWACFSEHGLWRSLTGARPPAPPPAAPPPARPPPAAPIP